MPYDKIGLGLGPSSKGSTCPIRNFLSPFWSSGTLQCPQNVLVPSSSSSRPFRVVSPSPLSSSESSNGPQIGVLVPVSFPYTFTLAIVLVRVLKWSSDRSLVLSRYFHPRHCPCPHSPQIGVLVPLSFPYSFAIVFHPRHCPCKSPQIVLSTSLTQQLHLRNTGIHGRPLNAVSTGNVRRTVNPVSVRVLRPGVLCPCIPRTRGDGSRFRVQQLRGDG